MGNATDLPEMILCHGGPTGRKIHLAHPGSSCTTCGHWMKANASYFRVAAYTPATREQHREHLCERCFGPQSRPTLDAARPAPQPTPSDINESTLSNCLEAD